MMCIARRAVTAEFCEDLRAASDGVIPSFQNEVRGAFAEGNAFALGAKRRTWLRIDSLQNVEPAVGQPAESITPSGDRNIGVARAEVIRRHADRRAR